MVVENSNQCSVKSSGKLVIGGICRLIGKNMLDYTMTADVYARHAGTGKKFINPTVLLCRIWHCKSIF